MATIEFDMDELAGLPKAAARAKAEQWRERAMEELARAGHRVGFHVEPIIESFTEVQWDGEKWFFEIQHSAAGFMEFGTAPHEIEPVQANVLHFTLERTPVTGGAVPPKTQGPPMTASIEVFTDHVDHPGTPALMFVQKGRERIIATEEDITDSGFDPEEVIG